MLYVRRLRQEIAATIPAFQAQLQQVSEVSLALQKDLEVKVPSTSLKQNQKEQKEKGHTLNIREEVFCVTLTTNMHMYIPYIGSRNRTEECSY